MMSEIAIRVENLSKRYRIGLKEEIHDTLTGALSNLVRRPVANLRRLRRLTQFSDNGHESNDVIWALKDVSFEVRRGEVLGIIGRNGAGKSTLLKILSRITQPTSGRVTLCGRVSSLLEVGTGFHPELTGRENVYLNGTILGMSKREVDSKFDEIVDFSGVGKFIDTPVKRYSSGMKVRLAFSVAAHLEPEILLIDEVLAVGDANFQKKCLNKMESVGQEGRTVLFVSHSMPAITRLCERAILLSSGGMECDGSSHDVVAAYLQSDRGTTAKRVWHKLEEAPGNEFVRLRSARVVNTNMQTVESVDIRNSVGIEIIFDITQKEHALIPHIALHNEEGVHVFNAMDTDAFWNQSREPGRYVSTAWIPGNLLSEGTMVISVLIITLSSGSTTRHVQESDVVAFHVVDPGEGDTARGKFTGHMRGACRPLLRWFREADYKGSVEQLRFHHGTNDDCAVTSTPEVETLR